MQFARLGKFAKFFRAILKHGQLPMNRKKVVSKRGWTGLGGKLNLVVFLSVALPPEKCYLPLEPLHTAVTTEAGNQFGLTPDSRLEYDSFPSSNTNR